MWDYAWRPVPQIDEGLVLVWMVNSCPHTIWRSLYIFLRATPNQLRVAPIATRIVGYVGSDVVTAGLPCYADKRNRLHRIHQWFVSILLHIIISCSSSWSLLCSVLAAMEQMRVRCLFCHHHWVAFPGIRTDSLYTRSALWPWNHSQPLFANLNCNLIEFIVSTNWNSLSESSCINPQVQLDDHTQSFIVAISVYRAKSHVSLILLQDCPYYVLY